jgi:hypothetical protein
MKKGFDDLKSSIPVESAVRGAQLRKFFRLQDNAKR